MDFVVSRSPVFLDKSFHLDKIISILGFSKIMMYSFHYNIAKSLWDNIMIDTYVIFNLDVNISVVDIQAPSLTFAMLLHRCTAASARCITTPVLGMFPLREQLHALNGKCIV
jgi:hypothetical protein